MEDELIKKRVEEEVKVRVEAEVKKRVEAEARADAEAKKRVEAEARADAEAAKVITLTAEHNDLKASYNGALKLLKQKQNRAFPPDDFLSSSGNNEAVGNRAVEERKIQGWERKNNN